MENSMSGIQPANLTNRELVHYATLQLPECMTPAWCLELAKRLEETLDRLEATMAGVPSCGHSAYTDE